MMKIVLPVLLAGIVMIAGIFAFIPVDKASTVHTTIQTTIQNTQLNNIGSTFQTDMSANATAGCGSGSSFLVYFVFSNNTEVATAAAAVPGESTILGIFNGTGNVASVTMTLNLENQTSVSGIIGGAAGATITFFGNETNPSTGIVTLEDVGDLALTVQCRSTDTIALSPSPT